MQIEHLHVSTLIPYANNAREHSEEQVSQIAASIKEFKFNNPVLVDKTHGIVAGHGRVLAAKKLGLETVPCIRLDHLSEAEKKAYIIADNKIADNSEFNKTTLIKEIQQLSVQDIDLSVLGFTDIEILPMVDPNIVIDPLSEWKDMPEYDQKSLKSYKSIIVHFETKQDMVNFAKNNAKKVTETTKFIWFPEQEEFTTKDREYQTE